MARRIVKSLLKTPQYLAAIRGSNLNAPAIFSGSKLLYSTGPSSGASKEDRIEKFVDPEVQGLLKELTGKEYERVFRRRKIGQKIREPKYSFMTEEDLENTMAEANAKAEELLQMPPVLRPREPINKILAYNPELQGYEREGVTVLFTDITQNISEHDRLIVARDSDGTLRHATWEEREKSNKIYFPTPLKSFRTPKMFTEPEVMDAVLARASPEDNTYEFILDRACLQFEPNDPEYIEIVEKVYNVIDSKQDYDYLYSTRHYGVLVFYLVRNRKMDNLLIYYIQKERIPEAAKLVSLFQRIFPECKSAQSQAKDDVQVIGNYVNKDAVLGPQVRLHLDAYLEEQKRKADLEAGIQRAHGLQG